MIEKIDVGREYINVMGVRILVLFVGKLEAICSVVGDGFEFSIEIKDALLNWSELPKPKKRYWLWDVKTADNGHIFKSNVYLDDDGFATNRVNVYLKYQLIKKHESEFIDIEEN